MTFKYQYDVFISYSSKDKLIALDLANQLKLDGLTVWLDDWIIRPGDMIGLKIQQGIEQSRTLILMMSHNYFESEWGTVEHHTLLFRDPTNKDRRFIPILIDDCILPQIIAQFAYIDWRQKSRQSYEKLLSVCRFKKGKDTKSLALKRKPFRASKSLKEHNDEVNGVTLTPDGHRILSCSDDTTLKLWDLESSKCIATFVRGVWSQL